MSIFQNYSLNTQELLLECFEFDWNATKLSAFIKDETVKTQTKEVLKSRYELVLEAYKSLSALSGSENFAIGSNVLSDFLSQCKVIDGSFSLSDLGVNWNVSNSSKTENNNLRNGLCRYEFLEILVRIAHDKYIRNRTLQTIPEAVEKLFTEHLNEILPKYDTNK